MEGSTCKPPPQAGANGSNGDMGVGEEIMISFGSFVLGKNGTLISRPSMIQRENAVSSCSLSDDAPSAQDGSDDTEKLAATQVGMEEDCSSHVVEIDALPDSLDVEWVSTGSVLQENVWEQSNICNARGMTLAEHGQYGQESPIYSSMSMKYTDNDLNHVLAYSYGSQRGQTYASSIYEDSSILNPAALVWNSQSDVYPSVGHMINCSTNFSPPMGSQFSYDQLSQIGNLGYCINNNMDGSTYFLYHGVMGDKVSQIPSQQKGIYILLKSRTCDGSEWLQRVLETGNYMHTHIILNGLLDSIFQVMTDDNGFYVFGMLIEKCQINQLWSIVSKACSEPDKFISTAFIEKGSKSIQRFIRRLKKTPMAQIITSILATRSYELLTHNIGSHVIRQCFVLLGEESNQVLYKAISNDLLELAKDPVGCISLNSCIDNITGLRRTVFLEYLAANSLLLANDPSGNFVVQHMLSLNNENITEKILYHLQGNFEQLAQKQGGSHIVEKCLKSSPLGLELVVTEILKDEKSLCRLASNMFGNYVIQTALKETKIKKQKLYQELLKALRPYYMYLLVKTRGKHVAGLIREDLALQKAESVE